MLLELVFQSEFQFLKGLSVGSFMFLKLMLQGGLNLLKVVFQGQFQRLEVWLSGEVFITAGLPLGDDFGLGFRHTRPDQALDKGVGVEGGGLGLHGTQNSGWGRSLQVGVALSR